MTRYLLDTNIVSEIIKPTPALLLLAWMNAQPLRCLFISCLTIAEIERGILEMPQGRKRTQIEVWFAGPTGPSAMFAGRILAFDEKAAAVWARLMAEGRKLGRPRDAMDMIIASTAERARCIVATANERDFVGLEVLNPLR